MSKSYKRMEELEKNKEFMEHLLEIHTTLGEGSKCPASDCNGTLRLHKLEWAEPKDFSYHSVIVLRCKRCHFQHKPIVKDMEASE